MFVALTDAVGECILADVEVAAEEVKLELVKEAKVVGDELSWTVVVLIFVLVTVIVL